MALESNCLFVPRA